jgi:hypothetical protein
MSKVQFNIPLLAKIVGKQAGIEVVFSDTASTASFNVKNKVMVLPSALCNSGTEKDVLLIRGFVAHEAIGHGIHTDSDAWLSIDANLKRDLTNILEDIRIEKAAWPFFPGVRQILAETVDFFRSQVGDDDFFGQNLTDEQLAKAPPMGIFQGFLLCYLRATCLKQNLEYKHFEAICETMFGRDLVDQVIAIGIQSENSPSTAHIIGLAEQIIKLLQDSSQPEPEPKEQDGAEGDKSDDDSDSNGKSEGEPSSKSESGSKGGKSDSTDAPKDDKADSKSKSDDKSDKDDSKGDAKDKADNSDKGDTTDDAGDNSDKGDTTDDAGDNSDKGDTTDDAGDNSDKGDTTDDAGDNSDKGDTTDDAGDNSDKGDTTDDDGDNSDKGDTTDDDGDNSDKGDTTDDAAAQAQKANIKLLLDDDSKGGIGSKGLEDLIAKMVEQVAQATPDKRSSAGTFDRNVAKVKAMPAYDENYLYKFNRANSIKISSKLEDLLESLVEDTEVRSHVGRLDARRLSQVRLLESQMFVRDTSESEGLDTSLFILGDMSRSMHGDAAISFMDTLLSLSTSLDKNEVPFAISYFENRAHEVKTYGDRFQKVKGRIQKHYNPTGMTPIHDAMVYAAGQAIQTTSKRKILLVITDGTFDEGDINIEAFKRTIDTYRSDLEVRFVLIGDIPETYNYLTKNQMITGMAKQPSEICSAVFGALKNVF